jgi:uncharacterized protein YkwD
VCNKVGLSLLIVCALLVGCGAPETPSSGAIMPSQAAVPPASPVPATATPRPTATLRPSPTATRTPSPSPTATDTPLPSPTLSADADPATREALLVAEINRVRAEYGLPPYLHNPELSAVARAHSCDLAAHGMISHTSSDGRTLQDRLAGAEPPWEWPSESIAAGTDDPILVVAWWMDEPPDGWHRRNILDADQREVGVGYCYIEEDASGNRHYWTADFSRHPIQ